jgi:digeranylgeranylglycerophospholipid reductase
VRGARIIYSPRPLEPVHEVAIVGAGPAGSMTAWRLAGSGLDVVVLERREEVGVPVMCGESLSSFALENNGVEARNEFIVRGVEGIRVIGPDGTDHVEPMKGHCIRRALFDQHLAALAVQAGADLRTGTAVLSWRYGGGAWMLSTGDGEVRSRVLVAADGPRSVIGRSVGLGAPGRMARAVQYKFDASGEPSDGLVDDHLRFYVREAFAGGYGWCFDRGHELNIGVMTTGSARTQLDLLCQELGLDPSARSSMTGGIVPQGGINPSIAGQAVVTVGDAAGLINPCSAGGIHAALHSGRVAAEHIGAALEEGHPEDLGGYEREMRSTPFCDPVLTVARGLLDDLDDEQWNFIIRTIRERDVSRLSSLKMLSRLVVDSPFSMGRLRDLRALAKTFQSYGRWGW